MATANNITRVELDNGSITVDASLIAEGLGVTPSSLPMRMQEGEITSVCERGVDEDAGLYRITFFRAGRRVRLIVDSQGVIRRRSSIDFGRAP